MTPVFWTGGGTRHRPQQAGVVLGNRHSTLLDNQDMVPVAVSSTEDLLKSLMRLCQLDLPVPDHTHLSRRAAAISVTIPRRPRQGAVHVVVDSTGLKIFGEGEWAKAGFREAPLPAAAAGRLCKADRGTVRRHGVGTRRTWPKVHRAVDETSKDIIGIEVTTATWGDSEILPVLLDQVEGEVPKSRLMAPTTATVAMRPSPGETRGRPSPRETARSCGETTTRDHPRDAILREIEATPAFCKLILTHLSAIKLHQFF